jgi:hypothetical protein
MGRTGIAFHKSMQKTEWYNKYPGTQTHNYK